MAHLHPPFRADHVGSFLRPAALSSARNLFKKSVINCKELEKVEDEEITKLISKEKAAGLKAVTDGEFRRDFWHLDFLVALKAVSPKQRRPGSQVKSVFQKIILS